MSHYVGPINSGHHIRVTPHPNTFIPKRFLVPHGRSGVLLCKGSQPPDVTPADLDSAVPTILLSPRWPTSRESVSISSSPTRLGCSALTAVRVCGVICLCCKCLLMYVSSTLHYELRRVFSCL